MSTLTLHYPNPSEAAFTPSLGLHTSNCKRWLSVRPRPFSVYFLFHSRTEISHSYNFSSLGYAQPSQNGDGKFEDG